jgi:hypothetical protein
MPPTIQIVDHFLEHPYLEEILRLKNVRNDRFVEEGLIKYTSEMKTLPDDYLVIEKNLNRQIIARLGELGYDIEQYAITLSILRISGPRYQGSLHHDKNVNTKRRLTVILYLNTPEEGGELIFPCYDKQQQPVYNELTHQLIERVKKHQFYADHADSDLDAGNAWMIKPVVNRAVIINDLNPMTWHKGLQVNQGFKMAYIAFFERANRNPGLCPL